MPKDVIMPALGVAQETGRVLRWLKAEGEAVGQGEMLLEIETDKATVELEATASGVLRNISAKEGDEVPVGTVIAQLWSEGEAQRHVSAEVSRTEVPDEVNRSSFQSPPSTVQPNSAELSESNGSQARSGSAHSRIAASPKARRLAAERGLDLNAIAAAAGDRGIVASDIDNLGVSSAEPTAAGTNVGRVWRIMAERTAEAWKTVPHFYLERQVDVGRLLEWREFLQQRIAQKITLTDLLIRLAGLSLRSWPQLNSEWRNGGICRHADINIGVAIGLDDGILVPVIRCADRHNIAEVAAERSRLVELARIGKLRPQDISGGTFTISNLGMYGIDRFSAIVNPPQASILAVGRVIERVVPVNHAPAVRPTMVLTLSCDHRTVDGVRAARFLSALAHAIEEPPPEET